jgi:hypothetical protein
MRGTLTNNLTIEPLYSGAANTKCTMSLRNATLIQFFQVVSRVVASRNIFASLIRREPTPIGSRPLQPTTSARYFPGERKCLCRISASSTHVGAQGHYPIGVELSEQHDPVRLRDIQLSGSQPIPVLHAVVK